jgi:hypothetical protein
MDEIKAEAEIARSFMDLSDAKLEQISRDESLRQIERDLAADLLHHRGLTAERRAARGAADARLEARQLARAYRDDSQDRDTPSAATGQRRGSEGLSKNREAAERFAEQLKAGGMNAIARQTKRIQGREVVDGWTVNVRDDAQEVGIVAAWWGRNHFTCFIEVTGHADRTDEAAGIVMAAMRHVWGGNGEDQAE